MLLLLLQMFYSLLWKNVKQSSSLDSPRPKPNNIFTREFTSGPGYRSLLLAHFLQLRAILDQIFNDK